MTHDFIIIGCGPTGSTAAAKLSMLGYSVLVFERTKFPRMHEGESMLPFCYPIFQELGVLEQMKKSFVRKPGAMFTSHDGTKSTTWCFKNVIHDESYLAFNVERGAFDKMLMENCIKKGAEVFEETKVESVNLAGEDKIVEVVTIDKNGLKKTWHSKFIIDASGQDTFLSKRQGTKKTYQELDRVAWLGHWKGSKLIHGLDVGLINILYLENAKKGWFALQSIGKDLQSVTLVVDRAYMKEQKKILTDKGIDDWQMAFYLQEIENCPVTKDILSDAKMDGRFLIISDYSYYSDELYGENFALLGDAYKYLDPIFSTGVYLGMKSSMLFAEAIDIKIKGDKEKGELALERVYKDINGAYELVGKFINIFYDPNSLNLCEVSSKSDPGYQGFEAAFAIHYLLAGDYFINYQKYSDFLDMIKEPEQFNKWKNLAADRMKQDDALCDMTYEQIFGEIAGQ